MYGRPCRFWQKTHRRVRSLKGMWWYQHYLEKASPCCPNSQCEVRLDLCSHCQRFQCLHPGHWYSCPLLTPLQISTKNTSWTLRRWLTVILTALLFWLVISMLMLDHQVVSGVSTHKTFMVKLLLELVNWNNLYFTSLNSCTSGPCYTFFRNDIMSTVDYIITDAISAPLVHRCSILEHNPLNTSDHLPYQSLLPVKPNLSIIMPLLVLI